ncbi:transposable element Tcb1 transposase [Trichonephila clavipes]|nr:transposable element Tcb1 transposase [Trichonephila clavipes]
MGTEFVFTEDNTHPHDANIVNECLQSEDISRMDWPAFSPDLNLVQHVWDMLGRFTYKKRDNCSAVRGATSFNGRLLK